MSDDILTEGVRLVEESTLKVDSRGLPPITGSSPVPSFKCPKCESTFEKEVQLLNHLRWVHTKQRVKICPKCHKEINTCGFKSHKKTCKGVRLCLNCGKALKKSGTKFCSSKCSAEYNNVRRKVKKRTKEVSCKLCNKPFTISNHARAIGNICPTCKILKKKIKASRLTAVKKNSYCLKCGTLITTKSAVKYCSQVCAHAHRKELRFKYIKDTNGTGRGIDCRVLKEFLILERGHECSRCHTTEWVGEPVPLVMDHINGRAYDNTLTNLRLVCGNCDMQLPTYKSKNRNSDRRFKRKT